MTDSHEIAISYKGSTIANIDASGTTTLNTSGTWMEDNITIVYDRPSSQAGIAGTPVATKGTVSNNSISITPSVTNTTGYINGGTINGTPITVSASELVSGTLSVNSSGTKDVTNYASVSIPSGSASTPATTIYPTITTGVSPDGEVMIDVSKTQSITPSVVAGYVSSGTAGNVRVSGYTTLQLDVYNGEHHQPPILTVSLTNPVNSSYFVNCEIYDETSGETKIGEIMSATGSVSIDLTDRFAWWDTDTLNIWIMFDNQPGRLVHVQPSGISCTGDVSCDSYSFGVWFTVTGAGTIVIDGVDYDY